jgi:hypothetical protein
VSNRFVKIWPLCLLVFVFAGPRPSFQSQLGNTSGTAERTESFDKPARKIVVNLGRSPYLMPNNPAQIQLSCFYYQDFMVKELNDPGLKGTRFVAVIHITKEQAPACRAAHAAKEQFIAKDWWSFLGAKGSLLFLGAADGDDNSGMPFRIVDLQTGRKIFEDSEWWNGRLEFVRASDETLSLRYLRVVGANCSIPKDGISCWSKFRSRYGIAMAALPKCTGYRVEGKKEWAEGDEGIPPAEIADSSVIAYPVAVDLQLLSIRPVPGPVKCSAVE